MVPNTTKRFNFWADTIANVLGWNNRKGDWYASNSYVVCDKRDDKSGNLEMVHIDGKTAREIRRQIALIIISRE